MVYEIVGYLGVKMDKEEVSFLLSPISKYSVDNKNAVGYDTTKKDEVKIFKLQDGKLECKIDNKSDTNDESDTNRMKKMESMLIQLALEQKKVLLYIEEKEKKDYKITGFKYPIN